MAHHQTDGLSDTFPIWELRLDELRLDGGTQMRIELDRDLAAHYGRLRRRGVVFPPVQTVFDDQYHWLWNGFHRVTGWQLIGLPTIYAEVRPGTQRDAIFLATGANKTQGERPKPQDQRRAVVTLLRDPTWRHMHNTEIADHVGVDEGTVRQRRRELLTEILTSQRGPTLSVGELVEQTGASADLVRRVRAAVLHSGGAASSELPNPTEEELVEQLTPYHRALYDSLDPEKKREFLRLSLHDYRELLAESQARSAARVAAGGSAARLARAEVLIERLRAVALEKPRVVGAQVLLNRLAKAFQKRLA